MEQYKDKQVVVLGLAKSGVVVAKLLHRFGAHVVVNDKKSREDAIGAEELEAMGIRVITGHHPDELIHPGVSLIVKNPGIPYESPPVAKALELGIPVITEVEMAYQMSQAPIIGITGSNGKTTTTTLVGLIFKEAGIDALVGGNIGTVLSGIAETARPDQWIVAELSSFQLMGTRTFRPRIAALMNVYPAHLDYHHTMDEYLEAKLKLFANQTEEDYAILPYDQPELLAHCDKLRGKMFYFSKQTPVSRGVYVQDGQIFFQGETGTAEAVMVVKDLSVPHLDNALAAVLIAKLAGADTSAIRDVLATFAGVEHRMEFVATIDGVKYYNDSKATNLEAATRAIQAFREPVVLLAGGLDRGVDFHELIPIMAQHVKAVVAFGQTAEIMLARAAEAGISQRILVDTVEKAVEAASVLALSGDVVLLSPACASWDMFPSFEVRGSMFKDGVHKLKQA